MLQAQQEALVVYQGLFYMGWCIYRLMRRLRPEQIALLIAALEEKLRLAWLAD